MFRRSPTTLTWRQRIYRRLVAAMIGLAAVVAAVGVAASPARADVAPTGTIWYQGIIRSWAQGRCLDSNHAGEVYSIPCNFGAYQQWRVVIWKWPDNQFPTVFIENVATGRRLATKGTWGWNTALHTVHDVLPYANDPNPHPQLWRLFPAYPGKWDAWVFSKYPSRYCLDANQPTDTTGQRPYMREGCGSNYQDWKMGF